MELAQREASGGGASPALEKAAVGRIGPIALDVIQESPTNPRKTFDKAELQSLAQSLQESGMIVRMLVRPSKTLQGHYEVVDGARRYRAAKLAGMSIVPAEVREMTDEQVLEAQLVNVLQRAGLDPLEEAEGYRALMKLTGAKVEELAKRVGKGKSVEYIYGRLKLLEATTEVKEALKRGDFTAGHAVLIARLDAKEQARALDECLFQDGAVLSVRELDAWIDREIRMPAAQQEEIAKQRAIPRKEPLVEVSSRYDSRAPKGALKNGAYQVVPAGETGPKIRAALIVDGQQAGKVVKVRMLDPAPKRTVPKQVDWAAERAKDEEKRQRERVVRRAILSAALENVKAPLELSDLRLMSLGFIDLMCFNNTDYLPKRKELPQMKPQAVGHLLIELSLEEELRGYGKPERLMVFAKAHKVNVDKVRKRAEEDYAVAEAKKAQTAAKPKTAKAGSK